MHAVSSVVLFLVRLCSYWNPVRPLSRQLAFKGSREEVELFFLTNALTFVVGWSWVILARDLSTLTSTALSTELDITELQIRLLLAALTAFVCGPLVGIVAGCL